MWKSKRTLLGLALALAISPPGWTQEVTATSTPLAQAAEMTPLAQAEQVAPTAPAAPAAPTAPASAERAEELLKGGDRAGAIGEYRALVAAQPENLEAWKRLGQLLAWDSRYKESLEAYGKALELSPGNREVRLEMARVQAWDGDLEASQAGYQTILEQDPDNREARLGLARAYAWDNRFEDALGEYDRMIGVDASDAEAHLGRGQVLSWDDRYDEALAAYRTVLEKDPENLEAQLGEARVMVWRGQLAEAVELYQKMLEKYPDSADVHAGLGVAKSAQGMDREAFEQLRQAVKLDPDHDDARRALRDLERIHRAELAPIFTIARDSDANDLRVAGTDLSFDADPQTRVRLTYRNFTVANVPQQRAGQADMVVGNVTARLSPEVLVRAHIGNVNLDPSGIPSENQPMGGLNVQLNPHPHHTINLGYNREVLVETAQLVENGIAVDNIDLNYRVNLTNRDDLTLGYQRSTFSDANNRNMYNLTYAHTFKKTWPMVRAGYAQKFQEYDRQTFNGYFSPPTFQTGEAFVEVEQRDPDDPWIYFLNAGTGYQKIFGEEAQFVYRVNAGFGYRLSDSALIELSGLTSNSAISSVQGFGYNAGTARMIFRF